MGTKLCDRLEKQVRDNNNRGHEDYHRYKAIQGRKSKTKAGVMKR